MFHDDQIKCSHSLIYVLLEDTTVKLRVMHRAAITIMGVGRTRLENQSKKMFPLLQKHGRCRGTCFTPHPVT